MAVEYGFTSKPDIPQDLILVQSEIPVMQAKVVVEVSGGWTVLARVGSGVNPGLGEVRERGRWVFEHVPAMPSTAGFLLPNPPRTVLALDYIPPGRDATFRSWQTTARWGERLFAGRRSDDPSLERAVEALRSSSDPDKIIDQVGDLVRRLRYFAIEVGWGGLIPRRPETTMERSFGDCKDKSHLMVELLRLVGVEAMPMLTTPPSDLFIQENLPGPRQFNHCVVAIPWEGRQVRPGMTVVEDSEFGRLRIFDPTLSVAAPQDIHISLEGARGLVVDQRTRELLEVPRSGAGENLIEDSFVWEFDRSMRLKGELTRRYRGASRTALEGDGGELIEGAELRSRVYGVLSLYVPGFADLGVDEVVVAPDGQWSYTSTFTHPGVLHDYQHLQVLHLPPVASFTFPVPEEDGPVVHVPMQVTFRQRDEVRLPPGVTARVPEPFEISNPLARVVFTAGQEENRILMDREIRFLSHEIPPEMREEATEVRRAFRRLNHVTLVLEQTSDRGPGLQSPDHLD